MSGSYIIAPALAGALYAVSGFGGILTVDLVTFGCAITTLTFISIPQSSFANLSTTTPSPWLQQFTFGLRYLQKCPTLIIFLIFLLISSFIDSASADPTSCPVL